MQALLVRRWKKTLQRFRNEEYWRNRRTLTTLQTLSILNPMEDEKYGNTSIPFVENSYKMIP